jgi:hypothetical protein
MPATVDMLLLSDERLADVFLRCCEAYFAALWADPRNEDDLARLEHALLAVVDLGHHRGLSWANLYEHQPWRS